MSSPTRRRAHAIEPPWENGRPGRCGDGLMAEVDVIATTARLAGDSRYGSWAVIERSSGQVIGSVVQGAAARRGGGDLASAKRSFVVTDPRHRSMRKQSRRKAAHTGACLRTRIGIRRRPRVPIFREAGSAPGRLAGFCWWRMLRCCAAAASRLWSTVSAPVMSFRRGPSPSAYDYDRRRGDL